MGETTTEEYSVRIKRDIETNRILGEYWNLGSRPHRIGQAAYQDFEPISGRLINAQYFVEGAPDRIDGPCRTKWHPVTGAVVMEVWARNGQTHRGGNKPAIQLIDPTNGVIATEEYWVWGEESRSNGPSRIARDPTTGKVIYEEWKQGNQLTRDGDQPAITEIDPQSDIIVRWEFWVDGALHNSAGPAIIVRDPVDGSILREEFYRDGERQPARELEPTPTP